MRTRLLRLPLIRRRFPQGYEPYGGSAFWALSAPALEYVHRFVRDNPSFVRFFRHVLIPDEIFFQTILLNSPLRDATLNEQLHYVDWSGGGAHPATLGAADVEPMLASGKLFARKFDPADTEVLDSLDRPRRGGAPMKAVILAGGFGTRLSEETTVRPKPMVEIGERPILWHIMKLYSAHGIDEFVICLGYKAEVIKDYFANYYLRASDMTVDLAKNELELHPRDVEPWRVTLVDTGRRHDDRRPPEAGRRARRTTRRSASRTATA